MNKRAFIISAFGDRRTQLQRLIKNIRSFVDYPVHIITTVDSYLGLIQEFNYPGANNVHIEFVDRIWSRGNYREGIRNSNYYKIQRALFYGSDYDSVCLLDDDMFIVDKGFVDGFRLAENFGAALPLNPRVYVKYNAMGADVQQKDIEELSCTPMNAPACNFSPFFVSTQHKQANDFLRQLKTELHFNACRGTLAIWKASWKTKYSPVYLPEHWCVCAGNAEFIRNYKRYLRGQEVSIKPMMLHLGHEKVRKVFGVE